jgi:prepilin-type N-terminal cleavage/methylation domain-containing protein
MSKAYTLIEVLIVIGVLAILTGLASLSMVSFGQTGNLDSGAAIVRGALKEAQANALANLDDKAWGVHLEQNRVILFADSGSGFEPSPDNSVRVLTGASLSWDLSGADAIVFAQKTGQTAIEGTITIRSSAPNTKTVSVNLQGMIE